jgi:hypothetical protein
MVSRPPCTVLAGSQAESAARRRASVALEKRNSAATSEAVTRRGRAAGSTYASSLKWTLSE